MQQQYNEEHGIEPATIIKAIDSDLVKMANLDYLDVPLPGQKSKLDMCPVPSVAVRRSYTAPILPREGDAPTTLHFHEPSSIIRPV